MVNAPPKINKDTKSVTEKKVTNSKSTSTKKGKNKRSDTSKKDVDKSSATSKKEDKKKASVGKSENMKKFTHLYFHDKFLTKMGNVPLNDNLTVLYLHNNEISKIEVLDGAPNITYLYLQKNKIKKIENLENLKKLRKLYLGHNEITVVENLAGLINLEELHIEKQTMPKGDSLCFDPRTVYSICKTLRILNVAHNKMLSIEGLSPLRMLTHLDASKNKLENIEDICKTLENMYYLDEASFVGNPVTKLHRYRENVIGSTYRLACLDGKDIKEVTRCFIKRFEYEKSNSASKQSINIADQIAGLPNNYPTALQKAASVSILKASYDVMKNSFDARADTTTYIPWKSLPRSSVDTTNRVPPLMRKQKKRTEHRPPVINSTVFNFNP